MSILEKKKKVLRLSIKKGQNRFSGILGDREAIAAAAAAAFNATQVDYIIP